jgi:hypothetical protein
MSKKIVLIEKESNDLIVKIQSLKIVLIYEENTVQRLLIEQQLLIMELYSKILIKRLNDLRTKENNTNG